MFATFLGYAETIVRSNGDLNQVFAYNMRLVAFCFWVHNSVLVKQRRMALSVAEICCLGSS